MSERVLMKGNEALAEAAIRSGCRHFFGYPITPQTELAAYMAKKMPKIGGVYLQAESEVAAVNMVQGAAAAGGWQQGSCSAACAAAGKETARGGFPLEERRSPCAASPRLPAAV